MKITWKTIKGNGPYAYLQRSTVNAQGVPVSKHVAYLGKIGNKVVPMDKISFAGETVVVPKIDGEVFKSLKSVHQDKLYPTWTLSSADVPTEVVAEQFKYWNSQQITNPDGSLKAFKVKHKVITDGVSIEPSALGLDQQGNPTGKLKDSQSAKTMLAKANAKDARTSGVTMTMTEAPPVTAPKRQPKPATPTPYATPSEILLVKDHPYVKNAPDSEKMDVANALVQDIKIAQGEPTIEDVIALRDHPEVKKVAGNQRMKIAKNLAYKANIKKAVEQAKEVDEKFTQKYAPTPEPTEEEEKRVWVNQYGHKASAQTNKPYTATEVLVSYKGDIAKGMYSNAKELLEANNITEEELLIEAKKEGYKTAKDAEKSVSASDLLDKYLTNEDANLHTENYQLLAERYGTPEQKEKMGLGNDKLVKVSSQWMYQYLNKYYDQLVKDAEKEKEDLAPKFDKTQGGPPLLSKIPPPEVTAVPSTMPLTPLPKTSEGATEEQKSKALDASIDMVKMAMKKEEKLVAETKKWLDKQKETPEQKKVKADAMKKAVLYVAKTPSYYSGNPETWADGPDGFHDEAEFIDVASVSGWADGIGPYADKYDADDYYWGQMDDSHQIPLATLQNKTNWMKDPRKMWTFPKVHLMPKDIVEQTTVIYDKETGHAGYITTWEDSNNPVYVKDANFWAWGGTTNDGDPDAVTGKEGKASNDLINVAMMINAKHKEYLGSSDIHIEEWDWMNSTYKTPIPTNTLDDKQTDGMLLGHKKGYTAGKSKGVIEYTGVTLPEQKEIAKKKAEAKKNSEAPKKINKFGEEVITVGIHDKTPSQTEWKATGTVMGQSPTSIKMTSSQVGEIMDWVSDNAGPLAVGQGFKKGTFMSVEGEVYSSELGKNIEVEGYGFEMGKNPKNVNVIKILKHPSEGIAYVVQGLKVTTAKPQGTLKTETNIYLSDTDIEGNTFANKFPDALATVTGNASMKQVAEFAEPIIKQTKEQSQALTMAQESLLDAVEYTNSAEGEADDVDALLTIGDKVIKTAPDGTKTTWWQISAYNPDGSIFENTENEPVMFQDGKVPKAIINAQSTGIIKTGPNSALVTSPMLEKYPKTHLNPFSAEQQYLQAQEDENFISESTGTEKSEAEKKQDAEFIAESTGATWKPEKMESQLESWQLPTEDNPYKLPLGGIDGMTTVSTEGDKEFVEGKALDAYMKIQNILKEEHEKQSMSAKSVQRSLMVAQQKKYALTPWDTSPSNVPWTGEEIYKASKYAFPKYFKSDSTFEKDGAFYDPEMEFKPTGEEVVKHFSDAGQEKAKKQLSLYKNSTAPEVMWKQTPKQATAPKTVAYSEAGTGYQTSEMYYPHEEILKHGAQGAKTFGTVKPLEGVGIATPTGAVKVPIMGMKTIEEEVIQAPSVNEPYDFEGATNGAVNEQGLEKYGSAIVQSVKAGGSGSGLVHKALANKARNQIGIMLKSNEGIKVGDTALNNLTTYNYAKSAGVFPDLMEVLEEDTQEAIKDTEAPFDQLEFSQAIAGVEKENETADLFVNAVDDPAVKEMEEEDKHGYGEWWDDTKVSTVFNSGRSWYTGKAGADEEPETLRIVSKEQVKRMIPAVVKGHYDLQERINKTIHETALNDTVSASERHKWYKNKKIRDGLTNYALGKNKVEAYVSQEAKSVDLDHADQIHDTMYAQAVWDLTSQGLTKKNAELIVDQLGKDMTTNTGDTNLLNKVTSHDGGYIPAPTDPFVTKYLKPTNQIVKKEVEAVIGYEEQTPEEVEGATTPLTTQKGVQPKINHALVTKTPSGKPHLTTPILNQLRSKALVGIGAVNDYANTLKLSKPAKKSLDAVVADLADQIGDTTGGQGQMVKDVAQGKVKGVDPTKPLETEVSRKKFEALQKKVQTANAKGKTVKWDDDLKYKSGSKGSNEGALYESKGLGKPVYVKWNKTSLHNKNEILANRLYELFGVPVPTVHEAVVNNKEGVLSEWVGGAKPMTQGEMSAHPDVHQGFIADAWLGNWDVAGQGYDNIIKTGTAHDVGDAYRIDTGGALLFRAQGNPKNVMNGSDFGKDVTELETLVDGTNMQSKNVFASLTDEQKAEGAKTLSGITDYMIDKVVDDANIPESIPNDVKNAYASNATYLSRLPKNPNAFYKERLKERRDNILQKVLGQGPVAEVPKNVLLGMSELSPSATENLIKGLDMGDKAIFKKTMKAELGSDAPFKALKKYYNSWKNSAHSMNGQVLRVASATANYHPDNPDLGLKEGLAELDAFLKTTNPHGRKNIIKIVTDVINSKEGEDLINAIKTSGQIHKVYFSKTLGTKDNVAVNEQPLVKVGRGWHKDQAVHELTKILESQGIDPHDKSERPKVGDYVIYDKNPSAHSWSIKKPWTSAQMWEGYVPYEAVFLSDRLTSMGGSYAHEDEVVFCCPVSQMKITQDTILDKDWKK